MKNIARALLGLSTEQDLKSRAVESFHGCIERNSDLREELGTDNYTLTFWSHRLTFEHQINTIPVIDTTYKIMKGENEIGYYSLITNLDGEVNDDIFVIHERGENIKV